MSKIPNKILVDFFYDIVSPYGYIGFEIIHRCNKQWGNMNLQLKPVFLGGIMAATGNQGPAMLPSKATYMNKDLPHLTEYYNMPFKFNSQMQKLFFQKGTLATQRMLGVVKKNHPDKLEPLSYELYRRTWAQNEDITLDGALTNACLNVGLTAGEAEAVLAESETGSGKEELKVLTQQAIDYGAFGVPTFVAHLNDGPKMVFGSDRIFLLGSFLGNKWPGPMTSLNRM